METELEDLQLEYERVHAAATISEKRANNFDKVSRIFNPLMVDLATKAGGVYSTCECNIYCTEWFKA